MDSKSKIPYIRLEKVTYKDPKKKAIHNNIW